MKPPPSVSVRASPAPPAAHADGGLTAAPLLDGELQRLLAHQGIEACQVALVDLDSLACRLRWRLDARGRTRHGRGEGGLSAAALHAVTALGRTTEDAPQLTRLSPRRWSLAWRLDALQAIHAELHFTTHRARLDTAQVLGLQPLCAAALRHAASRVAPEADGPTGARAARWRRRSATALVLVASVAGLWLTSALGPGDDAALVLARSTLRAMALGLTLCCMAAAATLLWSSQPEADALDDADEPGAPPSGAPRPAHPVRSVE